MSSPITRKSNRLNRLRELICVRPSAQLPYALAAAGIEPSPRIHRCADRTVCDWVSLIAIDLRPTLLRPWKVRLLLERGSALRIREARL